MAHFPDDLGIFKRKRDFSSWHNLEFSMYGKGNWWARAGAKSTVEGCLMISASNFKDELNELSDDKRKACLGTLRWGDKNAVGFKVGWSSNRLIIRLRYAYQIEGQEEVKEIRIKADSTRPHYGGRRWWLLCPGCGRRVAKLYKPPSAVLFACRHCHDLTYLSTRENERDKRARKMRKLRKVVRKDDEGNIFFNMFPDKPKYMRWDTYQKLMDEYHQLKEEDTKELMTYVFGPQHYEMRVQELEERKAVLLERFLADVAKAEQAIEEAKKPKRGTLGDVAQKAGVPYQFAKEAQAHGLISPDGTTDSKQRYRYKLASWLEKLYLLNQSGHSWGDLKAWTKRRFKAGHEHERRYPEGFKEVVEGKNAK